jgi:GT2 family glycosyltransferase
LATGRTENIAVKRVSIIIPSLRRPDLVEHCLACIAQQTFPADQREVIVVENDADAGAPVPTGVDGVRRILLDRNLGTTGSVNIAVAQSSSEYLLVLNNDVELPPQYVERLVSYLDATPDAAFATCKLLTATNRFVLDGAGDALLLGGGAYRLGHYDRDTGQYDGIRSVLAGCGAALIIRRADFEAVGGLDEDFFAYLDDMDLCLRLQLSGRRGACVGSAVAYHIGSATLGDVVHPRILEWLTRNHILLLAKNYPASVLIRVVHRVLAFQALWCLRVMRGGFLLPYLRGLIGALRLLPVIWRKRRQVMRTRKLTDNDLMDRLLESEAQIADWHFAQPAAQRSSLLNVYFALVGRPSSRHSTVRAAAIR